MNIDILGTIELKLTGIGEFNSDDHYIYYCGQESLRRNGVALIVNKSPNAVLECTLKNKRMISVHFQGKPFSITVVQVCVPTSNAEEAEVEQFYEDLQDLLELTPKIDVLFIIGDWNVKVESQEISGITSKFGLGVQNEAGQRLTVLPKEHTGHSQHPLPTTQEKTTHRHHQMVNTEIRLIIFFAAKDGEVLYSQQKQDREPTVAQIMNSLLPNSDSN